MGKAHASMHTLPILHSGEMKILPLNIDKSTLPTVYVYYFLGFLNCYVQDAVTRLYGLDNNNDCIFLTQMMLQAKRKRIHERTLSHRN